MGTNRIGSRFAWVAILVCAMLPLELSAGSKKGSKGADAAPAVADAATAAPIDLDGKPAIVDKCETCHGIDGNSLHFDFPKLAGQRRDYLLKQLRDIKSGKRKVDVMVPVVSLLTDEQMVELADYFSNVPVVKGTSQNPASKVVGKKIFDLGVPYRMVAQCSACHGTYGEGRVDPGLVQDGFGGFPLLNGQHAQYTVKQLKAFRSGQRGNDYNGMMRNLAKQMSDQEMELVADYLAGMELPPPASALTPPTVSAPPQVAGCVGCHGPGGNSVAPNFPKLAGQQKAYLTKQLQDMQAGNRKVILMEKVVEPLSPEDIEAIATYFSSQEPTTTPTEASPELVQKGMTIFFEGTQGVLACYSCHNFDGRGSEDFGLSPGGYPMLFGQHAPYLEKQLSDFKTQARKNDHVKAMHNIARQMSDEEIKAVAAFLQEMKF
ncbi:MAG: c-type cytochrome [Myxococcota bacterium]